MDSSCWVIFVLILIDESFINRNGKLMTFYNNAHGKLNIPNPEGFGPRSQFWHRQIQSSSGSSAVMIPVEFPNSLNQA